MIAILALAVKSTLILGAALLLCRLRCWSAAGRHLLLLIALSIQALIDEQDFSKSLGRVSAS